jgi:dienelactone hydrolase
VTALVYKPKDRPGRLPAVICTNGHWPLAKATPLIQQRCAGLARMGVVAFCQDVIGTGERQSYQGDPPQNYHGFYRGAAVQLVDRTLLGYILYECIRACDYLVSRDDIDPRRIFCTGASGGGKQSMFLPALDDRLAGAVPVCYVSSYQDHMGATACVGEVPPGVLLRTNQWEILAMHAPRPLLCIAASRDVPVFQPAPMQTAVDRAQEIYRLYGAEAQIQSAIVESGHDYNRAMRELLYRQVAHYLLGRPGEAIREPDDLPVESEAALRVGLPQASETLQSLTYRRARELVASRTAPTHLDHWRRDCELLREGLSQTIVSGIASRRETAAPRLVRRFESGGRTMEHWVIEPEAGVPLPLVLVFPQRRPQSVLPLALLVDELGKSAAFERGLVEHLAAAGWVVAALDYRGAGETAGTVPQIGYGPGTPEYNLCNYSLFVGRPLAGMRVEDVRSVIDFLERQPHLERSQVALVGRGRGALVGVLAAALDVRIRWLVVEELLVSWVFPEEFVGIGLSYFIPRVLTVADMPQLVAAAAPRPVLVLNPVDGRRRPVDVPQAGRQHESARAAYALHDAKSSFEILRSDPDHAAATVSAWLNRQVNLSIE